MKVKEQLKEQAGRSLCESFHDKNLSMTIIKLIFSEEHGSGYTVKCFHFISASLEMPFVLDTSHIVCQMWLKIQLQSLLGGK